MQVEYHTLTQHGDGYRLTLRTRDGQVTHTEQVRGDIEKARKRSVALRKKRKTWNPEWN